MCVLNSVFKSIDSGSGQCGYITLAGLSIYATYFDEVLRLNILKSFGSITKMMIKKNYVAI